MITRLVLVASLFGAGIVGAVHQDQPAADSQSDNSQIPEQEKPFWDSAQAFLDAYAERDAEAIGQMFTEGAEFRDEFGERTVGREAIVKLFETVFVNNPEAIIESIDIERIRYIKDDVVLEEGWVSARNATNEPLQFNRYVALHILGKDGQWRINTLKDYPREIPGKQETLDQLEWLIGDWVNEEGDFVVETSCRWSDDGHYLLRSYTVESPEGLEMRGTQRVAWDPQLQTIRSWNFDSEGAFNEGIWTQQQDQWIVTSTGVTSEGERIYATAIYDVVDPERVVWTINHLVIGGEIMPAGTSVILTRAAPEPAVNKN